MSTITPFQIYSQKENTITNNVLLLFSLLNDLSPYLFEKMIQGLLEDTEIFTVAPVFQQQVGKKTGGIIDGLIEVRPSKIVIETKISGEEDLNKLLKYTKVFKPGQTNILFHLSANRFSTKKKEKLDASIAEFAKQHSILFESISYQALIDQLTALIEEYPYQAGLKQLTEQFESYCLKMDLMPESKHILRAMACGQSFELNRDHRLYFDIASRGYSHFNYLGIYKSKAVQYIGSVENVIVANWTEEGKLDILDSRYDVSEEQKTRVIKVIQDGISKGWNINNDHRFFLFDEFYSTSFKKDSKGGLFRSKYFDLDNYLNPMPGDLKKIAVSLENKKWQKDYIH
jgi:hypothetical protein